MAQSEGAGNDDLAVADGDRKGAIGAHGHGPMGTVDNTWLTSAGLLVADTVPGDIRSGIHASGLENREVDGLAGKAGYADVKVLVVGAAACVQGLRVDHDNGSQGVTSIDGVGGEIVGVRARLVAEGYLSDLRVARSADDLSPCGPCVVSGSDVRAHVVPVVRLPRSSKRILGHVHLHAADLSGSGEEEEVEGPESVGKCFADSSQTIWTDTAHLSKVVGLAGDGCLLNLTGPLAELTDSCGQIKEGRDGECLVRDVEIVVVIVLIPSGDIDSIVGGYTRVDEVRDTVWLPVLAGGSSSSGGLEEVGADPFFLQDLAVDGLSTFGPLSAIIVDGETRITEAEVNEEIWLISDFKTNNFGTVGVGGADSVNSSLSLSYDACHGVGALVSEVETISDRSAGWEIVHDVEVVIAE